MENTGNNKKQFVSVKTQVDGFPEAEEALPNFPILSEDEDEEAIPRYTAGKYSLIVVWKQIKIIYKMNSS